MSKWLATFAALALGTGALAAEIEKPEAPKPVVEGKPGDATGSLTKTCPVLSRLGLTADQVKAIDKLVAQNNTRQRALAKERLKPKERQDKAKALAEELKGQIREALTPEQRSRYDAGWQVVGEFQAKVQEAYKDMQKAVAEAKDDAEKSKAARQASIDKIKGLKAEQTRLLDEKVGKPGTAPAKEVPTPGGAPAKDAPASGNVSPPGAK